MVDEYQDTNRPAVPADPPARRAPPQPAVVGDPDQSIYKWRGADIRNILDFEHDFPEAKVVRLERNYRSTQVILDAASAVIARTGTARRSTSGPTARAAPGSVYVRCGDELEEARLHRADDPRRRWPTTSTPCRPCSTAPTPSRARSKTRCAREDLPYRIVGGVRFYERKEIKDALAYLGWSSTRTTT